MLEKIEAREIMTTREARELYSEKFFLMVMTEHVDGQDNDRGYVAYAADNKKELIKIPMEEYRNVVVGFCQGVNADSGLSLGWLEVVRYSRTSGTCWAATCSWGSISNSTMTAGCLK